MRTVWYLVRAYPLILLALLLSASGQLAACGGLRDPSVTSTPVTISKAQDVTANQAKTLGSLKNTVDASNPSNWPTQKPLVQSQVATATDQNHQIAATLGTAAKTAKQDQKVIAAASDPVKVRLQWFGYSALISGIVLLVVGFIFSVQLGTIADYFRSGGAAAAIIGVLVLAVAYILLPLLHALFWIATILSGVAIVGGGVWVYLHRNSIVPGIEAWFGRAAAVKAIPVVKDVA